MKLVYKEDPRTIVIASNNYSLGFRALPSTPSSIDNASNQLSVAVELLPSSQVTRENGYKNLLNKEIFGCLGLIEVGKKPYLAVITGAISQVARPISGESVNKIYSVDFISLIDSEWDFSNTDDDNRPPGSGYDDEQVELIHPCTDLRKLLSNGSFYFSNDFDLTSLLQNRGIKDKQQQEDTKRNELNQSTKISYVKEYMWNSFMMQQLFKYRSNLEPFNQRILDDLKVFTTVIRGFAKTIKINNLDTLTIISKQSWKRAGTRFNARGIDDNGNVANFVETEMIYNNATKSEVYSFTQIRGSVPAFWEQDTTLLNPKITLTRSIEATQPIFDKHFTNVCNKYGVCHILNLLSKTKPAEVSLSRRYKELYFASNHRDEMEFSEFDFHQETKQLGFAGATKILPLLQGSLEQFGWFVYDTEHQEVVTRQDGVFRTNCLDCLDRTNLIQQVISRSIVEHILRNSFNGTHRDTLVGEDVLNKHNLLWADNGDAISQIYTGTNALKSSFSRSGKMNFAGALSDVTKSVSRMYQNTFVDNKKQTLMDILLGNDASNRAVKIFDPINEFVQEKLQEKAKLFTTSDNINLFVGTFNINAANPSQGRLIDLTSWLFPPEISEDNLPDIYGIGLQELIELNAGSILAADSSKPLLWAKLIEQQLNSQGGQYLLLRTELIASMALFLFVKKSQVHNITQVTGSSKKTGLGGIAANKGGCAVRFEVGVTSFALITSHLAAGTNAMVERYNDYQTIMQGLTFTRNYTIKDHDHIIWFGDMNYRVNLPNDQCRDLIENGAFDELMRQDQLNQEMTSKGAFHGFKEAVVKFYPTYKFDKGTSNYDTSEKQRVPSWTDRVLYISEPTKKHDLLQVSYNSVMDIFASDHKPVYGIFKGKVDYVDGPKKKEIAKQLYLQYKKSHGDEGEVSLLDLGEKSASKGPSSPSIDSSFAHSTLSSLNLLDVDLPPKLPARKNTLPKRIPPPPASRGTNSVNGNSEKMNTHASTPSLPVSSALLPLPPPPRRAASTVPVGFSSTPLIPSRSTSTTPIKTSQVNSRQNTPTVSDFSSLPQGNKNGAAQQPPITIAPTPRKPLVPSKPISLTATKTHHDGDKENETSTKNSSTFAPIPPAPRKTNSTTPSMSMSDWKPLVPK